MSLLGRAGYVQRHILAEDVRNAVVPFISPNRYWYYWESIELEQTLLAQTPPKSPFAIAGPAPYQYTRPLRQDWDFWLQKMFADTLWGESVPRVKSPSAPGTPIPSYGLESSGPNQRPAYEGSVPAQSPAYEDNGGGLVTYEASPTPVR